MSTTPNFSNFISNFTDLSNIDIVSTVSPRIGIYTNLSLNTYYGRYFCIGNLLIQFNDNTPFPNQVNNNSYQILFPKSYDSNPYTVMLTANNNGNNNPVTVTLQSFTKTSFTFRTDTNSGWVNFIAIGPRPSSLYTSSS